ncbi:MAG: hypothetical protein HYR55_09705 [Acidobacteria bacterium]|nr:hypothetical protein [Acidobacteriota bacterium]MBI3656758.1 hypothetical protein [Acidobacteriota bacterium]
MDRDQIKTYLEQLNDELRSMKVKGELCLYGGAVMCLVYDARPSTKDVDAVFRPAQQMRQAIERVARSNHLRENWLNDAVKGFLTPHPQRVLFDLSHLKVYIPEPDYLLAMKALAIRVDGTDKQDIQFLIQHLDLKTPPEVFAIVEKYCPRRQIKPATQFFIEELFGE